MARNREPQIFNISFLDVICGALGAVIFLFIAVPKGGSSPSSKSQIAMSYDTLHQQFFATIHDSLKQKRPGDTLLVILANYQELPSVKDCPACPECPEPNAVSVKNTPTTPAVSEKSQVSIRDTVKAYSASPPSDNLKSSKYLGDPPSVPCKVSFEIQWADLGDNIDLFVCKGTKCASGGAREIRDIGQWDSGKAKTKFFGSDLRTTQEAVRQFGKIIPGEYKLYARFKESTKNNTAVTIRGLIYSKNDAGDEKGQPFSATLQLNAERILLGTVTMPENGAFTWAKN